ncbi:MAG TPA: succinate--CoA ligase subunit beta, partial [Candidatus Thioglobus autotrophicus]|nr:succinate--CoA ligase subunit beta [Candidatus Thioglobus autotrophicus]
VIRLEGTNAAAGLKLLDDSNADIHTEADLTQSKNLWLKQVQMPL